MHWHGAKRGFTSFIIFVSFFILRSIDLDCLISSSPQKQIRQDFSSIYFSSCYILTLSLRRAWPCISLATVLKFSVLLSTIVEKERGRATSTGPYAESLLETSLCRFLLPPLRLDDDYSLFYASGLRMSKLLSLAPSWVLTFWFLPASCVLK